MNSWSKCINQFIQHKLLITLILGLIFVVPLIATAQEVTEEPQAEPVVTEAATEQPTEVETTVAPTEATVAPTEEPEVVPEATEATPEPEATVEETDVFVEATEEVVLETTEEATVEVIETEEAADETETPVVVESPVEITSFSEDFEAWTGDNWTVTDWSVVSVDDSLSLFSDVENATAQVMSLDWTNYTIDVDVRIEAGNTVTMNFGGYTLLIASDGRNRLSQGEAIIATSPVNDNPADDISWHHVNITKGGPALTVTVDDIPQYTVAVTDSPIGIFAFVAVGDQGVAIDNLLMAEVDEDDIEIVEVISTPTPEVEVIATEVVDNPEVTEEPDLLAEVTEEPDLLAEATEEPDLLAEVTEEPDLLAEVTEEPDLLAEATEEPVVSVVEEPVAPTYVVTNIITEDFEGDLSLWTTTASIVEVADDNHVLLISTNGQLAPVSSTSASGVVIAGQANIMADVETSGSFTTTLSGIYTVEISSTGITISENGEVLVAVESAQALSTWFAFAIEAKPEGISVSINDAVVAEYAGELALDGNFGVTTNTSIMLEDITVDSLTVAGVVEPLATETPEILSEDAVNKLGGVAGDLIQTYLDGGDEAVTEFLATTSDPQDEFGRVLVDILASNAYDGATIAQLATNAGGDVTRTYEQSIEAYVDVNTLIAIAGNEGIRFIRDISRAVSTGPTGPVGTDSGLASWTEGFNLLSIEEWNLAGVDGEGVKIGVIDTGFQRADESLDGNIPCIANTTPVYTPDGSGDLFDSALPNVVRDHGTQIIEVICDIAPAADVYMFRADDPSSLQEAISAARNPNNRMDVLLITLDLGANTSAGGGISGSVDANVYGEIEAAKNTGMVVVVAAGNNNQRTLVLQVPAGETSTTSISLQLTEGDKVKFGWNDFGDNATVVARFDVALSGADTDSANSNNPVLNPLSLTADTDGAYTLSITPSNNGSTTAYLQVQISPVVVNGETPLSSEENDVKFTSAPTLGGGTLDITDTTGNLGRPADSDHVISVGAICTRTGENPTRWEFSSNGPRFKPNGSPLDSGWDDTITQDEAKPSIMSYSFITTKGGGGAAPEGPDPVDGLLACTDGLGGTSASAAHVAGMVALLMSNDDNASFDDMNEANATSGDTFEAIRDYLQARSVDLPFGADADGFDITYGAGLSILGAPTYDLDDTTNPSLAADLLPESCVGATYYVGQDNMGNSTINGSLLSPFTSIAHALNAESPIPECIIVMPGEYVSPLFVENSYVDPLLVTAYDDVSRIETGDVVFWLRSLYFNPAGEYDYGSTASSVVSYRRRAGLYFGESSSNVEFSGFTFVAARFYTDGGGTSNTSAPQAVVMDGSTDTTISNSQFGKITLNGVEYPGWNNIDATPIQILNGAEGAHVANNIFNDNSTASSNFYPTVAIINSGEMDNPVTVIGNEMYGNSVDNRFEGTWGGILYSEGSHIDIINNAIHDNVGETIIKVTTTNPLVNPVDTSIAATHTRRARIVGNVFLNNSTASIEDEAGPLINGHYAPMIYIINNTMISNTIPSVGSFGQFFGRGNANDLSNTGSAGNLTTDVSFWEIHNNLIYNNTYRVLVGDTFFGSALGCNRIPNDTDSSNNDLNAFAWDHTREFNEAATGAELYVDRGAQNNWIVNNTATGFGACQTAIATSKTNPANVAYDNQNIIDADNQPVHMRQILNDDSPLARDGDFQGILTQEEIDDPFFVPTHDVNDWEYYALTDTLIDESNGNNNEFSDGIDAGKVLWLSEYTDVGETDPYLDHADVEDDIVGTKRILDVNDWEINWLTTWDPVSATLSIPQGISTTDNGDFLVDIGAFEFSPLQFEFNCTEPDCEYYDADQPITIGSNPPFPAQTFGLLEDSGTVTFDFSEIVTGGFGKLTFSIKDHPANYGAQCDDKFENTKGLVNQGVGFNEFFDYCPPPNFYTSTGNSAPDYVSFVITVRDEAGAVANGEVRFTIDPVNDGDLPSTPVIGEDAPAGKIFEVVTTLGTTPSVRLRPYTRFGNFFFSENDNPDFESGGQLFVDYPFSYTITNVVETDPAEKILVGAINDSTNNLDLGEDPVIGLELSDANKGTATIIYSITDGRGNISTGNELVIRSVSIIPDEGLHDDTSFVWNYSDAANAAFYTERDGHNSTDVPGSGQWKPTRKSGAINDTLHTTSALNDTATFRFIGTGFTVFMHGVSGSTATFDINIYDDDDDMLTTEAWTQVIGSTTVNEVAGAGSLACSTQAAIDGTDQSLLVQNLDEFRITCNGLDVRKHTVQIVNTGAGEMSVDAFSIIKDDDLNFGDADPIPPGFHDVDNGVLRNAFNDVNWDEAFDRDYSNGVAFILDIPQGISFTVTRASGFAIGTTYRDNAADFNICVENITEGYAGLCSKVEGDIDQNIDGIHIPFFGLDPAFDYTITLQNLDAGFIFDDLIVFSELLLPVANLPLGTTAYTDLDMTFGEPFGNDWVESDGKQVINEDRSPIGPFISFRMDDNIDTIGITADNVVAGPACTPSKKVVCPPPPPSGFSNLAVCVNRGNVASENGINFGNCIFIDTFDKADSDSNTFSYVDVDGSEGTSGNIRLSGSNISNRDGMIVIPESLFDDGAGWGDFSDQNTVEIFSLYPDSGFEFESVSLFSSGTGLGEGLYTVNSPGIFYVEYDQATNAYTEVTIDDASGAFETIELKQCTKFKKGTCQSEISLGTIMGTTGIGNAILFPIQGTGLIPRFTESEGTFARVCIVADSHISASTPATIAAEIQSDAQEFGGCEILDLTGEDNNSSRYISGLNNVTHHVMIELLPSPTHATPSMNFDGLTILGGDLVGLDPLTPGQVYETSYATRDSDNMFLYSGIWETKADSNGTHLGTTYDETDDEGAFIAFKTTGGNVVNIIRDLKTSTEEVCTGKKKNIVCTPGVNGYSDITVCVAPADQTADRNCSVHKSDGNATQVDLPISLNTAFDNTTDYVVSITASEEGFAIDAVEVLDTSADKMTVGIYQESSSLMSYENGQTEILKNTSFENTPLLSSGNNWDWSVFGSVSASISTSDPFIGLQFLDVDGNANDSVISEEFNLVADEMYTIIARINVISGTVEMRSVITGFEVQSTQYTDKWELLRYSFVATATESAQLEFAAAVANTSFQLDDVHVYKGGTWSIGEGGLGDGKIATSSGYGSQAQFMFTGTGFTIKLASDHTSGETQVCYDNGVDKHCFTYDDEGSPPTPPVCTGKKKKQVCTPAVPSTLSNGHTVVGLTNDDYVVTIQQRDNGLKTKGTEVCTGSGKKLVCVVEPGNQANDGPTTVKIDSVQIYNDAQPPVLTQGIYNEDTLISNDPGMHLFPADEWEQIIGDSAYSNNSYYQVKDAQTVGSLLALKVDNDPDPVTVIVDINQPIADANQVLVCSNDVNGAVSFNGTSYELESDDCVLTDKATNQTQLVFNQNNLVGLDGSGGDTLFTMRSLTKDSLKIDGYQVLYGSTLPGGYYEEIIGASEDANAILQLSSDADWDFISNASYSGLQAIKTAVSGATIDFTFEGTGVSIITKLESTTVCTSYNKGVCKQFSTISVPSGLVSVDISSTVCGGPCTFEVDTTDIEVMDGAITIAGLPDGIYDVTLTTTISPASDEVVVIDAIEIFGDLQELGSLYDDAQVNVNGTPLLTFGSSWTATTNDTSGKFLNNTKHTSSNLGATLSFVVGSSAATEGIVIFDGNPSESSSNVEVCWSTAALVQNCENVNLDDGSASTPVTFTDPGPGNYSVSITNKASGEPLVIDAIQVIEDGIMAEGIYQDDHDDFIFSDVYTSVIINDASDSSVMQLDNNESLTFTFEGIAFSALIIDNTTFAGLPLLGSNNFDVCVYPSGDVSACASVDAFEELGITRTDSVLSAVSYGGFHNNDGSDNGEWTVVITNRDATNDLFIDRIDILGNHNELEITDSDAHESGEPQIRYLPFSSWVKQTDFKDGTPLNGDRHETVIPGSMAYFEFNDDFGSGSVGIEYIRQFQDEFTPDPICTKFKKGTCKSFEVQETIPALAGAEVCYGEVGDPSTTCLSVSNGEVPAASEDAVGAYQFGTSTDPVSPSCVNGCWGSISYDRDSIDSLVPLDYIRLYDPDATLAAGVYQESHPNIKASETTDQIADLNANVAFYEAISGTVGDAYFYFPFEGTGFSVRTFAGSNADEINLCVYEYSGGLPDISTARAGATCLRTYDNVQTSDGFVTRALHGLHHDASYLAFVTMNSDGSTILGLDQVTVFSKQWYDETDLSDGTYLKQLMSGNTYPVDYTTRNADKIVQFIGNWETVSEQILLGYEDEKKQKGPIYTTLTNDRGMGSGTTALFRVSGTNATTIAIELGDSGIFEVCATPMTTAGAPFTVDVTEDSSCQTFMQEGSATASFLFGDDLTAHVITIELLTDTWMNVYNIDLYDVTNGLGEGLYDHSAPGIQYDASYDKLINEDMEETDIDWLAIGSPVSNTRSGYLQVCVKIKKGICRSYATDSEPHYDGDFSRKLIANIGQGIQYVGSGSGVSLDTDTHYTAIARVYVDPNTAGGVEMKLISDTETISEVDGLELSTLKRGTWQTIRADFYTEQAYPELYLQIVAIGGQTTFFVDAVMLTTGGQWTSATPTVTPTVCTGKKKSLVCIPGGPLFDAYGGSYYESTTPGASFTFDFVGTGFELGLVGGNSAGEVEVCYSNEVGFANPSCFTYSQDDGVPPGSSTCVKYKGSNCVSLVSTIKDTTNIIARSVVGLENDTWTVIVRDKDDGYSLGSSDESRDASFGLDFIYIFEDTDIVTVDPGSYNEDAQDVGDNDYLRLYPENEWQSFSGSNTFSKKTYVAPTKDSLASTLPGPAALIQINVDADDEETAIVFQSGGSTSGLAQNVLVCVDETNGKMEWDGTNFVLVDSDNCLLLTDVDSFGQVNLTNNDIAALNDPGLHNITVTALSQGLFRIDSFQVFNSRVLAAGVHNEKLPATILNFAPGDLNPLDTCDPLGEWCSSKTKVVSELGCIQFKKGKCKKQGLITVESNPYIGAAATTSNSGATANFVIYGTGFSLISDVNDKGLDFRVCYKLESSGTAFPALDSDDETLALNGYEEGTELPILIGEGGVLCDNLTTDTDNWATIMDRPESSGEQYGFSFYGLPLSTYEVQVMVTTPQNEITSDEWFTLDAINVFSDIGELAALQPGLTDDADSNISYEPSLFWESNSTSNTYELTDSTTDHAGAISQFKVEGNTLVVYQTIGEMSTDVQICLLISNENIHCSVEAERQSRLARQVTTFTQEGGIVIETVCVKFKKNNCKAYGTQTVQEVSVFTPVVFYGLGEATTHTIIMENRVQNETFNLDAIRVLE